MEYSRDFDHPGEIPSSARDALQFLFKGKKRGCLTEERLIEGLAAVAPSLSIDAGRLAGMMVEYGWLGRWTRLRPDEKTIKAVEYGPMPALERLLQSKEEQIISENRSWLAEMEERLAGLKDSPRESAAGIAGEFISSVTTFLEEKLLSLRESDSVESIFLLHQAAPWTFKWNKPRGRFHLGVEFLLALLQSLKRSPAGFEWKELGAGFAAGIGGSKRFDRAREELIALAETISGIPLDEAGLTSRGSLYSLYLLGRLIVIYRPGEVQEFLPSTIHALTNVQVQKIKEIKTFARRVVLTENRALLLKMERYGWQCLEPESLVIGIDGRLRLGHARFLKVLRECNPNVAWFAWLDTDASGTGIAGEIARIIPGAFFVLPRELAGPPLQYEGWLAELEKKPELRSREQEEDLGDPGVWQEIFKVC